MAVDACMILLLFRSECSFQKPWLNWKHFCSLLVPPHNNIDPLCITNDPKLRLGKVARDLVPKSPIMASKVVKSLFVLDTIKQLMCSTIKKSFYQFKHIRLNIQLWIYLVFILLAASSTSSKTTMISFQHLQVCLAEQRLLISRNSKIFFKISEGKT